jgi:hypothetical protein
MPGYKLILNDDFKRNKLVVNIKFLNYKSDIISDIK